MQPDWKQVDFEKVHWIEETRLEAKKAYTSWTKKEGSNTRWKITCFFVTPCRSQRLVSSMYMVQILVQSNFELKYYSPTVTEGKTFVLVFCNIVESIHCCKRLKWKFCLLQWWVKSTLLWKVHYVYLYVQKYLRVGYILVSNWR